VKEIQCEKDSNNLLIVRKKGNPCGTLPLSLVLAVSSSIESVQFGI
jgi:hypothetical protein